MALAAEGVHVTLTARGAEALAKTAAEIRKSSPGATVTEVACDITTPAGREAALKACPDPDILVNNAGGPPPATSATGPAMTGSRRSTPTCSPRSN
jgi:3-oxoacyl-[acyl-carrier protein] reductase